MNSIDANTYNNYDLNRKHIGFKSDAAAELPPVQVPDMYYIPDYANKPKSFKETVKQVDVMGLFYQWVENPLLMLATCAGLSIGIDAFDRSCNKEYSKSIIGKAARLGDKIEKSKPIQSKPVQKIFGGMGKGWEKVKNVAMKNDVIKAFFTTPSRPENSMPKHEMQHTDFHVATQFKELARDLGLTDAEVSVDKGILGKGKKGSGKPLSWKEWDLNKEELNYLKEKFGVTDLSKVSKEEISNRIKLKRLGLEETEITSILSKPDSSKAVREAMLKKGGQDAAWLEKILKNESYTKDEIKEISAFCENIRGQRMNKSWCKVPVLSKLFSNIRGTDGIANKLSSMGEGAETKTGRFMSKLLQKFHRGITFGGGKLAVLFWVGPMMLEAFLNTKKADKKEKVGTLVSGVVEPATWVFTFPLILRFMHGYGGIQYAGMDPDKVKEYRNEIEKFNKRVDAKEFTTKQAYDDALKNELKPKLKELRKVENEGVLTTILRKISHITKCDLEKIKPYNNGNGVMNFLRKIPNKLKDITFGYVGRFALFMLAFMPILDKVIKKGLNACFGKSYDSMKEEEFADLKKEQEIFAVNDLSTRLEEAQRRKLYPETANKQEKESTNPLESIMKKGTIQEQPAINPEEQQMEAIKKQMARNNQSVQEQLPAEEPVNSAKQETENRPEQAAPKAVEENAVPAEENKQAAEIAPVVAPAAAAAVAKKSKVNNVKRDNYTYIPSQDSVFNNKKLTQVERYIPAQTASNFSKTFDNSKVAQVLKHANRAEQRAINVLGGNFENM